MIVEYCPPTSIVNRFVWALFRCTIVMRESRPLAKAHSQLVAHEYLRLGWTLVHEFREPPVAEPYEYLFEWQRGGEPVLIDWNEFRKRPANAR